MCFILPRYHFSFCVLALHRISALVTEDAAKNLNLISIVPFNSVSGSPFRADLNIEESIRSHTEIVTSCIGFARGNHSDYVSKHPDHIILPIPRIFGGASCLRWREERTEHLESSILHGTCIATNMYYPYVRRYPGLETMDPSLQSFFRSSTPYLLHTWQTGKITAISTNSMLRRSCIIRRRMWSATCVPSTASGLPGYWSYSKLGWHSR
jgi:hypothetical protein